MEQCPTNSQQLTRRNAYDAASVDILPSSFYLSFLDSSKATQAPPFLHSHAQQQYAPDSGAFFDSGESPPLPCHIPEQPLQGHPRLDPPSLQQHHQLYPTVAYPTYPHDYEGPYPTPQGLSHQPSRASAHFGRPPIHPWSTDNFSDYNSTQPTALHENNGPPYALPSCQQPQYHSPPTHRSAPTGTHALLEQPQPNTAPVPSTLHERLEDRAITDHGHWSRSSGGVGSLDPVTGVFCRAPDHPRIRTAQACEKCRARKAKCSGKHPTCQRCLDRRLECKYAVERRMRGPNKPKPLLSMSDGSPQPALSEGQKPRKRASTLPTASVQPRLQMWGQQQQQKQSRQQQKQAAIAVSVAAATAASPTSSTGSGNLGYPPQSESEVSPMTPYSSLDSRHSTCVSFPDLSLPFDNLEAF